MARQRLDAASRRHQIAGAARVLFATHGYAGTTTRDLARAAEVSDALLYRHFDSKRAVLDAVVTDAIDAFAAQPPLERMSGLDPSALLMRLGAGFLERVTANLDVIQLLIAEHSTITDTRFVQFIDRVATALGDDLARRAVCQDGAAGYLLARTFFGSLVSFVLLQRTLGMDAVRPLDDDAYLQHLVERMLCGSGAIPVASEGFEPPKS